MQMDASTDEFVVVVYMKLWLCFIHCNCFQTWNKKSIHIIWSSSAYISCLMCLRTL